MKLYEFISAKDKIKILFMWILSVVAGGVLCFHYNRGIEDFVIVCFVSLLFFLSLIIMMINDYVIDESERDVHANTTRLLGAFGIGSIVICAGYMLEKPIHFFLAVSTLLCTMVPIHYGLMISLMLSVTMGLCVSGHAYDLAYCVLLCLYGAIFSKIILKQRYQLHSSFMIFALSITHTFLYQYILYSSVGFFTLLLGCVEGICNVLLVLFLIPILVKKKEEVSMTTYAVAMGQNFPLAMFLKSLSIERYTQCVYIAKMCLIAAKELGFDESLCACAGLYYDLCDNDEENPVEYATILCRRNLLPIEAVRILSQYHGSVNVIRTKEAALVDLVYETMMRLSRQNEDTECFEKEMMVHSIFNELSKSGRYDESGLSINKFIKLRDVLIHEVEKNDNSGNK